MLFFRSYLAVSYAELGQFDDAWHCIGEALAAIEVWEAEVNRIRTQVAGVGRSESRGVFRARTNSRASTAREILGCAPR